jgi:Leucine Rich repeat
MKSFTDTELDRISQVFESSAITKQTIHLQSLNCSGHAVSPKALHRFGAAINTLCKNSKNSNFASLAIGDATMGDIGIQAFVDGVLSSISHQHQQHQKGDGEDSAAVHCSLATLDLSYKGMTITGLMAVAQLCNVCTSITHLNLSRNTFTYMKGALELPQIMDVIFRNVIELDLSSCEIDTKFTRRIFQYLDYSDGDDNSCNKSLNNDNDGQLQHNMNDTNEKKRIKRSSSPTKYDRNITGSKNGAHQIRTRMIRLDNNPIGDKGLKQLLKLNRLSGIYVSNCQLTDAAMLFLTVASSSSLNECSTLDISSNKAITKTGMTVLGDALKRRFISVLLPKLTHLNISGNEAIGTDGVQALLMGLAGRTLETCDFSETHCSGPGAILAIVGSVKSYCCTIKSLRLYNNHIGSNGFYKISEILSDILMASELHTLDLAGNNAGQGSVVVLLKAVLSAIEQTTSKSRKVEKIPLKCLIVGGNQGGFDVEAVIKQIHALRPDIDIARDKKGRS